MPVRIVQSKQNARLKELRRALATPAGTAAAALAGIEGPNLLEEALRAGLRIDCVFVAQGAEHLLEGLRCRRRPSSAAARETAGLGADHRDAAAGRRPG
jgi:tRNA G18 (ribose-2'-O)-methylase SpoU